MELILQQLMAGWDVNTLLLVGLFWRVEKLRASNNLRISKIEWHLDLEGVRNE